MNNIPSPTNPLPPMEWDRAPWNRWSFHHMREIVPTAEVWRGDGPVSVLPMAEKNLDGLKVKNLDGAQATLTQLLAETYTDGFIVMHYFGTMTPRSLHLSQSVAKSITGMAFGVLADRGLLYPKQLVTHYLPELRETGWEGATLQHVLDMTTGVRFDETYTDPHSDMGQLDVACGWKPIPPGSDPKLKWPSHIWEQIMGLKEKARPHGAAFDYRSIETDVLAFAMERVTGKRLPQIVSEELWQKLGMEESGCFTVDRAGYAIADGGFNATLRDYGRFGQMVLSGGAGIVPSSWIDTTRNGDHAIFPEPYTIALPQGAYHNKWWIEDPKSRNLMARGVFGQWIYIDFTHDMVIVKVSSWPVFLNPKYEIATLEAAHAIAAAL
jgi:CubicO group peptidase (beta-lactamase class C family)